MAEQSSEHRANTASMIIAKNCRITLAVRVGATAAAVAVGSAGSTAEVHVPLGQRCEAIVAAVRRRSGLRGAAVDGVRLATDVGAVDKRGSALHAN